MHTHRMTKAEAKAFQARWHQVNAAEQEELRNTSPDRKLQQLAALMASIPAMGWIVGTASEEVEVRKRWMQLQRAYCDK